MKAKPLLSSRLPLFIGLALLICGLCGVAAYSRYVDWPSLDDSALVRSYLPEPYPIGRAHHYTYRQFMDTWDLYRFTTSAEGAAYLAESLNLTSEGMVSEFPLILSKPPPYWWDPELLQEAELFRSQGRAPDGRIYELLYSEEDGIAYLIRFDG